MDAISRKTLIVWSSIIGFVLGGIPVFLFSLNPPRFLVIPVGPCVMSVVGVLAMKYIVSACGTKPKVLRGVFIGLLAGISYVLAVNWIFQKILGAYWQEWGFFVLLFVGVPVVLIDAGLGGGVAWYVCKHFNEKKKILVLNMSWLLIVGCLAVLIFIGAPTAIWFYSH